MYVNTEIADNYQEFFNFMNQEHGLILTIEQMDEIVSEAQKLVKKLTIPNVVEQSEQLVCGANKWGCPFYQGGKCVDGVDKCKHQLAN